METNKAFAYEKGYVETLMGRRLYLSEIRSRNMARRRAAERVAINAPMQGTAADIIKLSMIDLHQWIQDQPKGAIRMIMQVHDELVFEVKKDFVETAQATIKNRMQNAAKLAVPLIVDIGLGDNWEQAH